MRGLKRIGVLLTITLAFAASQTNVQTVLAAEEVVSQEITAENTTAQNTEETVKEEKAAENTEAAVCEETTAENTEEVVEEVTTTEEVVADTTASVATFDLRSTSKAVELEEATAYTTWNANNCHDDESLKNEVLLNGEEGEMLSTIFKINFNGAHATYFDHNEDLTDYCSNLPKGLTLKKYTTNTGADYMRVELAGQATAGKYDVTVTVPTEKLSAYNGYYVPEEGLTVTFYLTVNGEQIPVTVPVSAPTESHEHSYSWHTIKQATDCEDGLEAYMCDCGDIEYTRVISAYGLWLESVKEDILTAEENAVVEVKTDIWNTYNKSIMDALSTRSDVTLVTTFGSDEEAVTFTIPAGASTVIVEEATALAASVDDATGIASTATEEESQWFGFQFLSGAYAN